MGRILSMILGSDPFMLKYTKNYLQLVTMVPSCRDLNEGIWVENSRCLIAGGYLWTVRFHIEFSRCLPSRKMIHETSEP